jgi:GTP-binding protein HflX
VIDVANPEVMSQIESVNQVLLEIGCGGKPVLELFNKVDVIKEVAPLETLQTLHPEAVTLSAKTGLGLDELRRKVIQHYRGGDIMVRVTSRVADGKVQSFLRAHGEVLNEQYSDSTVVLDVRMGQKQLPDLERLRPEKLEIVQG